MSFNTIHIYSQQDSTTNIFIFISMYKSGYKKQFIMCDLTTFIGRPFIFWISFTHSIQFIEYIDNIFQDILLFCIYIKQLWQFFGSFFTIVDFYSQNATLCLGNKHPPEYNCGFLVLRPTLGPKTKPPPNHFTKFIRRE